MRKWKMIYDRGPFKKAERKLNAHQRCLFRSSMATIIGGTLGAIIIMIGSRSAAGAIAGWIFWIVSVMVVQFHFKKLLDRVYKRQLRLIHAAFRIDARKIGKSYAL